MWTRSGARVPAGGFALAALAIAAVGLLLRLHRIGEPELWLDEAVSWAVATGPDLPGQLLAEGNGPLYHVLLRAWTTVAGTSEAALRAPSALAGAGLVAAVAWLGRALFGRGVGLWSASLAALAPLHVHYSQEVRAYALMTCLVALGHLAAWRALERDTWARWTALGVVAAAAMLAHYLAVLSLLAAAPFALAWGTWRQRWRCALALAAAGLVVAVWIVASMPHAGPRAAAAFSAAWLDDAWQRLPPWLAVPTSLELLGLGSQAGRIPTWMRRFQALEFPPLARWGLLSILASLGLAAAAPWGSSRLGTSAVGRKTAYLFGLLLTPLLLLWGASYLKPLYLAGRYDLVALPAFLVLAGLGLGKLQGAGRGGRWRAGLAAAALLAGLGLKLDRYFASPADRIPSARATASVLAATVEPADIVLFSGHRELPMRYYLRRQGYRWEGDRCTPADRARAFTCMTLPRTRREGAEALDARDLLAEAAARGRPVWLVAGGYQAAGTELSLVLRSDVLLVGAFMDAGWAATATRPDLGILRLRAP